MKLIITFICSVCIYVSGYSQDRYLLAEQRDSLAVMKLLDSFKDRSTKMAKVDSLQNVQMTERWNTSTYNPYKNATKTYPFNITFTDSTFASPIPMKRGKVITSHYGWRNRRAHKGIDIDLVTGDHVMAMLDGKVRYVKYHSGHGRIVVIRHFNGLETVYAHLSKQLVKVNDTVKKGQIIGKGGTTGNARGSHLHLEVIYKGVYINPEYVFDFGEDNKIRDKNIWVTKKWATPYVHSSKRQTKVELCTTYEEAMSSKQDQTQVYVVRRGDTLSKISNKYQVSITSLCKTNAIAKTSILKVGQKLVLNP